MFKRNTRRIMSGVMSLAVAASFLPCFPAYADEQAEPEKYPYTMFAASNTEGAITINADNVCINGSIATNGTIASTSPNFNVNGTKTENVNEEMIYIQKKLNYSYFSGDNVEMYADDYTLEEQNININNPMDVNGTLEMTGNINLNSGINALEDVNLNGEVKNTNNSVIFSETGDININTSNTNFSGLIYAPYGDIVIDTDNLNLNNVVIIGQTITLDCPSINANYSTYMAEMIGTESDIDVELYAMGEYNSESNSIDIEWHTNYTNNSYEIWISDDNADYTSVGVVSDGTTYHYPITEDFEKRYFKVSLTTNYGEYIESVPFLVTKTEEGYSVDFLDSDEDGLPDIYEIMIGTDINNVDSDDDGLIDYQEVYITGTDPTKYDSVTEGVSDAYADSDGDGLSNAQEIELGTDPKNTDTDGDTISDYDELYVHGTDPLIADTDGDTLSDADEIALGLNPLLPDSYNDGINDGTRKFVQTINYTESDNDLPIKKVNISFNGTGYINSTTSIETDDTNVFVSNLLSIKGKPFRFESTSAFDEASVSFVVDKSAANVQSIDELGVVWYDEDFHQFRMLECSYDENSSTVIATVPHFSIYCVVNREEWVNAQGNYYFIASNDLTDNDNDKIPDCYESSNAENPENMYVLSNGTKTFSLKGEAHSDKQETRGTMYDVVTIQENGVTYYTDGIIDGEEVVFCTGGDVNCDNIVNNADVALLESYLAGNKTLSAIGKVNADCNLDGKINEKDVDLINGFIGNGYDNDVLSETMGDINRDGIVNVSDLIILADYIIGKPTAHQVTIDRADFTGDGTIDVYDLILMRKYLVYNSPSIAGFSYFYCVSDPMTNDTDNDLDWDQADPDPMKHQLNGEFARNIGRLQKAANEFFDKKAQSLDKRPYFDNYMGNWLAFSFIRCFNPGYNWNHQNWSHAAGKLKDTFFNSFKNFLNSTTKYKDLCDYFEKNTVIYSDESGGKIDLYHMCATLSAYSFKGDAKDGIEEYVNNLSGWLGDFRTLVNSAYKKTYTENKFETIYDAFYNQMGRSDDCFSKEDLYADVASFVIGKKIEENRDVSYENLFNEYFVYSDINNYMSVFGKNISYNYIKDYASKKVGNELYNKNLSEDNINNCVDAFVQYIYDNYKCKIE